MKPQRLLLNCLFAFLLVLGLGTSAMAQTITLEATTESGSVPTGFNAGQNLQLYISVDDANGIAGAAFTLHYPSDILTPPVTDVDGVPQVTGEIDSFFPFMYVNPADTEDTTDTWRSNSSETGMIYFSGAAIDTSDGGAQYDTTGSKDLFVVTFTVKEGASLGNITDGFSLEQTELFNPDAGYGTDVGGDGTFDDGVDSTGLVPVLVGALSTADTTGPVDGFGGDLSDDFPILLDENDLTNGVIATLDLNIINDADYDGVTDDNDLCADTPAEETPDANGCAPSQLDTDNDGVTDDIDTCADTPAEETANANGCAPSQLDTDNDGVTDDIDTCADTPAEETADANGCAPSQRDSDNDGVTDDADLCAATPAGETADANGCSDTQTIPWQTTITSTGVDLGGVFVATATFGVDSAAEALEAAPAPPQYTTNISIQPSDFSTSYSSDIRQEGAESYEWIIAVNPHGNQGTPADASSTLSWDESTLSPTGFYQLREGWDGTGSIVVADMRTTTEYVVTGGNADQYFTIEHGNQMAADVVLAAGWNLVSLPVTPEDNTLTALFPDATVAYGFSGSYSQATSLTPGSGYWVKVTTGGTYTITGQNFAGYSTTLAPGWHLMGAANGTSTPTSDPAAISVMYGFAGSYAVATEFASGSGYWVKITAETLFTVEAQ